MKLLSLAIADDPAVWRGMGFSVTGDRVRIGSVDLVCVGAPSGPGDRRGILGWTFAPADDPGDEPVGAIDGIPVAIGDLTDQPNPPPRHPNGVTAIDHLVISTPDLDRSVAAFESIGLDCRRQRERTYADDPSATVRQAFFWLGDPSGPAADRVLCEVVGPKVVNVEKAGRAASFFGLALTSEDLDTTARVMGDALKAAVTAVQAGRRIATVRASAGSTVAIAIMSPHVNPDVAEPS